MKDAAARAVVGAVLARTAAARSRSSRTGAAASTARPSDLRATVRINDPAAWRGPLHGSIGLGEGYVDGLWETDDLVALIRIGARSLANQHRGVSAAVGRDPQRPPPRSAASSPRTPAAAPAPTSAPTTTSATTSSPASSTRR